MNTKSSMTETAFENCVFSAICGYSPIDTSSATNNIIMMRSDQGKLKMFDARKTSVEGQQQHDINDIKNLCVDNGAKNGSPARQALLQDSETVHELQDFAQLFFVDNENIKKGILYLKQLNTEIIPILACNKSWSKEIKKNFAKLSIDLTPNSLEINALQRYSKLLDSKKKASSDVSQQEESSVSSSARQI